MKGIIKTKVRLSIFTLITVLESLFCAVINVNALPYENERNLQPNPNLPVELQSAQKKLFEQLENHKEQLEAINNMSIPMEMQNFGQNVASMNKTIDNNFPVVGVQNNISSVTNQSNMIPATNGIDTTKGIPTPNMSAGGWKSDGMGNWYFYDYYTTQMVTGYFKIDEKIYYFEENQNGKRPYGQLYMNEKTIDGFIADANGVVNDFHPVLR